MTMPTVTPVAPEALALRNVAQMLAASTAWQAWTGAANATAAEAFIWIREAPMGAARPLAVIGHTSIAHPQMARGSTNLLHPSGRIMLYIEAVTPSGEGGDPDYRPLRGDAYYWFLNQMGAVRSDLEATSGAAGSLNIENITLPTGPFASDEVDTPGDEGAFWFVNMELAWK